MQNHSNSLITFDTQLKTALNVSQLSSLMKTLGQKIEDKTEKEKK